MWKSSTTNVIDHTFARSIYYVRNETRSNLPFQMALYVNLWFFPVWLLIFIVNLDAKYNSLTNIYKVVSLMAFLILSIAEVLKLYLGYAGNLAGKIPELASCWFISILIQFPLEMFLLLDHGILSYLSDNIANSIMISLLLIEIVTGVIALKNLANYRAKTFYLKQLYSSHTVSKHEFDHT